ncbi:hypothetical protein DFH09DRAFT_1314824 [Mycena vulgaris]|nr:hypothetical protein DFH09DRAFT_1314824 [Mycena vulgaris]
MHLTSLLPSTTRTLPSCGPALSIVAEYLRCQSRRPPAVPRLLRPVLSRPAPLAPVARQRPLEHTRALSLPRTLARPSFTGIARDALLAAAPELSGVPAEFIRHGLRAKAPQMLPGIAALVPSRLSTSPRLECYVRLPASRNESRTKRKLNQPEVDWIFETVMTSLIPCTYSRSSPSPRRY